MFLLECDSQTYEKHSGGAVGRGQTAPERASRDGWIRRQTIPAKRGQEVLRGLGLAPVTST